MSALCLHDQQNEDKDCFVPLALIFFFLFFFLPEVARILPFCSWKERSCFLSGVLSGKQTQIKSCPVRCLYLPLSWVLLLEYLGKSKTHLQAADPAPCLESVNSEHPKFSLHGCGGARRCESVGE